MRKSGPDTWFIGLAAWVIQDGSYEDFKVGDTTEFAIEAAVEGELHAIASSDRSTKYLQDNSYAIDGVVVAIDDTREWWAIALDGLSVVHRGEPVSGANIGTCVNGTLGLWVDPFFSLGCWPNSLPPLTYSWRVRQIFVQTAPWVKVPPQGLRRDLTASSWRSVAQTDAWKDDDGRASYVCECELMSPIPKLPPRQHKFRPSSE